jgi:hypothetical protein
LGAREKFFPLCLLQVLSVPPGANAADDAVRPLILGDRNCPWHTVAVGLPMLVMDWNRYESRHASFSPALVSTINFLNSRVVPVPEGKRRCTFSRRCGCSGSFGRFIISGEVSVVYD